jgi:hypothetical protein
MPDIHSATGSDDLSGAYVLGWVKRPFPRTLQEFETGVNEWLAEAWGPDWQCPQCKNRWWFVLEAVNLAGSVRWPVGESSSATGVYIAIPVTCTKCRWLALILARPIFEDPPEPSSVD